MTRLRLAKRAVRCQNLSRPLVHQEEGPVAAEQQSDDAAPLDPGLLEIMACPDCKSPVGQEGAWIVCQNPDCGKRYPIRDGIPVMLVEEAVDPKDEK